jgi:hypothetical protein
MIQIYFKGLEPSELAREVILERIAESQERFPQLLHHRLSVTLSMENSPDQKGPDLFGVRLNISGPRFQRLMIEKRASSLYLAAAQLQESLLEFLNRASDRPRVKARRQMREFHSRRVL